MANTALIFSVRIRGQILRTDGERQLGVAACTCDHSEEEEGPEKEEDRDTERESPWGLLASQGKKRQ